MMSAFKNLRKNAVQRFRASGTRISDNVDPGSGDEASAASKGNITATSAERASTLSPPDLDNVDADVESSQSELHPPRELYIALMGVTGAGKSSFISLCTEQQVQIGGGLESCKSIWEGIYLQLTSYKALSKFRFIGVPMTIAQQYTSSILQDLMTVSEKTWIS